ncbi:MULTISPECIES: hypothetical protein [Komagataeibacter]|uniref:hypothetical protein n=1 Tax=Komagataeibacter TaxID=1434011 RepID=UPI000C867098|nr:hypothetical protein [Komagataeibacter saccharivorans]MBL7235786.1 hypothetical protein [Novacetimonas hansenii]PYD50645.1 hypothetical protein CFR79_08250 [Komagataeibacter saccharivorans]QBL92765.1 hypothetical protein KSAC_05190 [Komagataeibacter saccharivorans]GBQ41674.1 hypothetical protein AA0614_2397 [Komagataeibacter saccharivorans NRIC 0614]
MKPFIRTLYVVAISAALAACYGGHPHHGGRDGYYQDGHYGGGYGGGPGPGRQGGGPYPGGGMGGR